MFKDNYYYQWIEILFGTWLTTLIRSWSPSLAISLGPGNCPLTETRLFVWQRRVTLCILICEKTKHHIIMSNPSFTILTFTQNKRVFTYLQCIMPCNPKNRIRKKNTRENSKEKPNRHLFYILRIFKRAWTLRRWLKLTRLLNGLPLLFYFCFVFVFAVDCVFIVSTFSVYIERKVRCLLELEILKKKILVVIYVETKRYW